MINIKSAVRLTHALASKTPSCLFILIALAAALPAQADASENAYTEASKLEIVTSALGVEQLTRYSANRNALGMAWGKYFGMEASYFDVGNSRFAKHPSTNNDDVGGRVNLKLALDVSTALSERSRLYSRVGMYVWEVDVNYNRSTNRLDTSRESNSSMVGVGAVYGEDWLLVGIELEQVNAVSFDDQRNQHRVLFNMSSRF